MKPRWLHIPRRDDYEQQIIDMGHLFRVDGECPQFGTLHEFRASEWYGHPTTKYFGPTYKCLRCEARGGSGTHLEYGDFEKAHKLGAHCSICGHVHHEWNVPSTHRISPEPLYDDSTGTFLGYLCPPCGKEQRKDFRFPKPRGKEIRERAPQMAGTPTGDQ